MGRKKEPSRWLVAAIVLATLVSGRAFATPNPGVSPAEVVQAFLRTCYTGPGRPDWPSDRVALARYGAERNTPPGGAAYSIAAERWAIHGTRLNGDAAEVDADIWIWHWQGCDWSARYYPAKRFRLTFTLVREDGRWRIRQYHPLLHRRKALAYRNRPFYMVIAGSFRTEGAAQRHAQRYVRLLADDQCPALIEPSGHFANLWPGWFIVVPCGGETFSPNEAQTIRRRLAQAGVSAYVRRIR